MNFNENYLRNLCKFNLKSYSSTEQWDFVNYLDTGNITDNKIDQIQYFNIKTDKLPSRAKRKVKINDIIYSTVRPNQKHFGIIKENISNFLVSTGFTTITTNEKLNSDYLYFYLSQNKIIDYLNSIAEQSTSAYPSIKPSDIGNLKIKIPSIEIQRKIAFILNKIETLIKINSNINKNLDEQITEIYKSWFINFDPFKNQKFIKSDIGIIPHGWDVVNLGDVLERIKNKVASSNLKVFSAVKTGNLELSEEYFTKQVFSKNIEKYIIVKEKDFAYNPARVNIGSIGRNDFDYDGCVSPVYIVFRAVKEYNNFISMFIKTPNFKEEVVVRSSGSVRQNLNYEDFSLIRLVYPPKDIVEKFNNLYEPIMTFKKHLNKEIIKLEKIRNILLPKLMSGEIDVSKVKI